MPSSLRILVLEADPKDAKLLVRSLKKSSLDIVPVLAKDKPSFLEALDPPPDLILADHDFPQLDGSAILAEIKKTNLDVPVILFSDSAEEEQVVKAMKAGAADFLVKNRLERMPQALERALQERKSRAKRRPRSKKVREEVDQYREIVEETSDLITRVDLEGKFLFVNSQAEKYFGLSPEDCVGRSAFDFVHPEDRESTREAFKKWVREKTRSARFENRLVSQKGQVFYMAWTITSHFDEQGEIQYLNSIARDISDLRNMKEKFRGFLRIQEAIIEASPAAIFAVAPDNTIMVWNESAQRIFGWTTEEVLGKPYPGASPDQQAEFKSHMKFLLGGGRIFQKEVLRQHKDGTPLNLSLSASPIYDEQGKIIGAMAVIFDITERKKAENSLLEREKQNMAFFENPVFGAAMVDLKGRFFRVNDRFCKLTGYSREELLTLTVWEITHPLDRKQDQELQSAYLKGKSTSTYMVEKRYLRKEGQTRWVSVSASLVRDEQNRPLYSVAIIQDITEQKKAEEEKSRLLDILDKTPDIVSFADPEGHIQFFNSTGRKILGLSKDVDLTQRPIASFHPPWAAEKILEQGIPEAIRDGSWLGETAILEKNGREIPTSQVVIAHRREDGTISHLSTVIRDIREQKILAAEMSRLVAVLEATPDTVIIGEVDGGAIFINDAGRRTLGIDEKAYIGGMTIEDCHPAWAAEKIRCQAVPAALKEGTWTGETALRDAEGREIPVSQVIIAHPGEDGTVSHLSTIMRDISDRVEHEEALKENQNRLELALEAASMGAWTWSVEDDQVIWSDNTYKLFGLPPRTVIKGFEHVLSMVHPDDQESFREKIREFLETGSRYQLELRILMPDGTCRWMVDYGQAFRDETGRVNRLAGVIIDITERKMAEDDLRDSKNRLELALEAASMGTWDWSVVTNQALWDDHTYDIFGIPKGTIIQGFEHVLAMIHPDDRGRVQKEILQLTESGSTYRSEYRILRENDEVAWVGSRGQVFRDKAGRAERMIGVVMDITELKSAEESLHRTAETLQALIDSAPLAIAVLSHDGQVSFWNPAAEKIFGWSSDQAMNALVQPVPREEREQMKAILSRVFAGETLSGIELLRTRKDGSKVDVRIFSAPIRDSEGSIIAALGIAEDITESKLAEAALRQTTDALQSIINASPLPISAVDRDGRVTLWNHAAEKIYGWRADEVQGKVIPTIPEDKQKGWRRMIDRVFAGETLSGVEGKRQTKDGRLLDVRLFTAPLRDLDGRITSIMGIAEDVTEIKRAHHELERTQKRLKAFLASDVVGISFTNIHGRLLDANDRYLQIIGYSRAELENGEINWRSLTPKEFLPLNEAKIEEAREKGGCTPFEKQYIRKDGSRVWVLIGFVLTGPNQEEIVTFVLNITDRKLDRQRLEEQKERLDLALDAAHMGVWDRDLRKDFHFWDETVYSIFHRNPELPVPSKEELLQLIHPDDRTLYLREFERAVSTLGTLDIEHRILLPDGQIRHIAARGRVRPDETGRPARIGGVLYDNTEEMENLKKLEESEEAYRLLFDSSPLPMWVYDLETYRFLTVNEEAVLKYGWSRDEFLSMSLREIRPSGEIGRLEEFLEGDQRNWLTGQNWVHETRGGKKLEVLSFRYPLQYNGRPATLVVSLDVTERNQREREMAAITALTTSLREARSNTELQGLILEGVRDLLQADGSALILDDPEAGRMRVARGAGTWRKVTDQLIQFEEPCALHVVRKNLACINSGPLKSELCRCPCFGDADMAVACVPMVSHDRTLGVLSIGRKEPIRESDLSILRAMGDIAGTALHRSELHEQTERQLNRLVALRNIDLAITSSLDLRLTLDILLEQLETHMRIDASSVLLLNHDLGMLEYAAGRGFRTRRIRDTRLRLGESRAGEAAMKRQPVIIPDFSREMSGFVRNTLVRDESFQAYCAVPLIAKGEVQGVLETFHRAPLSPTPEWLDFLESIGLQAAIAIENSSLFTNLQRSNLDLRLAYDKTIEGWSRALDLRDKETEGHSIRVTENTVRLAKECGMSAEDLVSVRWGALLHDIGKMGVPDQILLKPGPLDEEEWRIMKQHPVFAQQLLSPIPHLKGALDIPYAHHEKWDGSGYPRGLKGEAIPYSARIFAVIDVWDALRSDRPYRPAWTDQKARNHITEGAGSHFDPNVVEAFLRLDW